MNVRDPFARKPGSQILLVVVALAALLAAPSHGRAAIGTQPLHELHQQVWTTRDGIPHNTVNSIAQTRDGYLWFGTWEGVARFNGHQFRIFERGPVTGLPDAGILSLTIGPKGQLLAAGARGGNSVFNDHDWYAMPPVPALVSHAMISSDGSVWIATQGEGIFHRTIRGNWAVEAEYRYLPGANAADVIEDDRGRIHAATSEGLLTIVDGDARLADASDGLPAATVLSLLIDDDGRLLVGTESGLYVETDTGFELYADEFRHLAVSAMLRDRGGALWIGTINNGLIRKNESGISRIGTEDGLPNNRILSLYQDAEGSLWAGTNGGLFRLRSAPFVTYTREQGLAGNFVRAVLPMADGSLWIGTSEGVSRMIDGTFSPVLADGEPFALSTLSLAETADGDVLIGTHSNGARRWSDGRIVASYTRRDGLPSNDIRNITEDSKGRIWIGTASGLARVDDQGLQVFGTDDGLPHNFVMELHEDRSGILRAGTGFGLAEWNGKGFEAISFEHLDQAMYIFGISEQRDAPGTLWLASDRGLIRYHPESGKSAIIGRDAGIPVDSLFRVVDDRHGAYWLTSNRGILRIQRDDAAAVADGRLDTIDFELYTEGDGMNSAQANGSAGPAAAWHNGRVWVATAAGLATVDPEYLTRYENTVLPVSIELFTADGEAYPIDSHPELPAGTGRVAIHYAGLGFIMPHRILYRTRLDGFDDDWVDRKRQSVSEYTNLGPGTYTFHVSAAYPYGSWGESKASIEFSIAPMPWQRTGFWIAAIALAIVLVILLIHLRMRQLERRARQLREQVDEKTHELKTQAEEFEQQARIDQLTGLANRRAFDEWLAQEFRHAKAEGQDLSLVVVDLDHFKRVNDNYTHLVGDEVMRIIADVLRQHVRQGDQAARWGGEEFTLTFHDSDSRQAAGISERIRATIEETEFGDIAPDLRITASFGISDIRHADSYEALLRQADQALYRAKSRGRNCVMIFDSDSQ